MAEHGPRHVDPPRGVRRHLMTHLPVRAAPHGLEYRRTRRPELGDIRIRAALRFELERRRANRVAPNFALVVLVIAGVMLAAAWDFKKR